MLAGICKWDDFSSVYYECFSYNDGGGDNDGTGAELTDHLCRLQRCWAGMVLEHQHLFAARTVLPQL